MEKRNSKCEHGQPMEQKEACFARATRVWPAVNHSTSSMFEAYCTVNPILCNS